MSIADKLITIAENQQKVYEAGKKAGAGDNMGTAETVTGNPVRLDYMHPTEHEIGVKLSSDTITDFSGVTIKQYGKNLFQSLAALKTQNELTFTPHDDGTLAIDGTASATTFYELGRINLVVGQVYRLSGGATGGSSKTYQLYLHGTTTGTDVYDQGAGKTFTATDATYRVLVVVYAGALVEELLFKPMVVLGNNSGEYEPYMEPTQYTVNADGTVSGVMSVSPTTTLSADGVNITATYYVAGDYQYHRFWDAYQDCGNRQAYDLAFAGACWTPQTFKPKYIIRPGGVSNQYMMFARTTLDVLDESVIDTSQCTAFQMSFYLSSLKSITLDVSSLSNCQAAFSQDGLLETVVMKNVQENCKFPDSFSGCNRLANLTVTGTIGTTLDVHWSPLSKDSILSVFDALSATCTGQTATFKKTAVEAVFTTEEWDALIATKTNWTIALA